MSGQTGGSSAPAADDGATTPHAVLADGVTSPAATELSVADGARLARFAARVVASTLRGGPVDGRLPRTPAVRAVGASFVTLQRLGELRGCIGTLEAVRPLYLDVLHNAVRAMSDPRLARVDAGEWPALDVGVSVLGPLLPALVSDLDDLMRRLRPGLDGVVIAAGARRATFLPVVWHKLPDPAAFLSALLAKGGWAADRLPDAAQVFTYRAVEFHDLSPRPPLPVPG
jgi:AmmeMemoRadiSam system protein A